MHIIYGQHPEGDESNESLPESRQEKKPEATSQSEMTADEWMEAIQASEGGFFSLESRFLRKETVNDFRDNLRDLAACEDENIYFFFMDMCAGLTTYLNEIKAKLDVNTQATAEEQLNKINRLMEHTKFFAATIDIEFWAQWKARRVACLDKLLKDFEEKEGLK